MKPYKAECECGWKLYAQNFKEFSDKDQVKADKHKELGVIEYGKHAVTFSYQQTG